MPEPVAKRYADLLIDAHLDRFATSPNAIQAIGYAKIGAQVERFLTQAALARDVARCRQILFANIPEVCARYSLQPDSVQESLEAILMLDSESGWLLYQEVLLFHEATPLPHRPSFAGCVVLVASGVATSLAFVGLAARVLLT